ncbi:MAG: hypothetical protein NTV77_01580 [Candidatus Azambacteria bacterium]|nr:hypothetical protein [Candidatus Azambacteria bacterium]
MLSFAIVASCECTGYHESLVAGYWISIIPMPLRIAYLGLKVKPKTAFLLFCGSNCMDFTIKKFSFLLSPKTWFEPIVFSGSLAVLIGAAPPPFRIFAGGLPRRLRRRNAFGLIQEYCTTKEIASFEGSPRFARRLIRIEFSGQKRIGDFERRKENFLIFNTKTI